MEWTAKNANGIFHKKSSVLKTIHITSSDRKHEKVHERLFLAFFAVHIGKKKML
jgi:hypothetical protein